MPNYSLVINSQFKPFSYAELAAPVMEMSNYHERLAQEYDNLSKQADVLEAMGQNDRDKQSGSYNRYKSYSDALRKEADNLYAHGLNTESRQRLTDLRRRYNIDIVPIQNAWTKREKEADEQMKASLQNPSLMFTRDAASTSLDSYIANPTGGYGVINGANISAQMGAMAKNLEKQILDGSARKEDIDGYTYDYIRKYGLTPDMIRDWRSNPTLSKMFEQVMQANGVTPEALNGSANAQSIIDKSTGYAEIGMWNAIGEDKATQIENYGARLAAQEAKERRMANYNHTLAAQAASQQARRNDGNIPLFFDQLISPNMEGDEGKKTATTMDTFLSTLKQDKNGQYNATVNVSKGRNNNGFYIDNNAKGGVSLSMTDNNGRVLSEAEFVSRGMKTLRDKRIITRLDDVGDVRTGRQSMSSQAEARLREYYQNNIGNSLSSLGLDATPRMNANSRGVSGLNINDVRSAVQSTIKGSGPYQVNAVEYRFGDNNEKVLQNLIPRLMLNADKTVLREITNIGRDGAITTGGSTIDKNEFVDDKGNAKGKPLFYRINTPNGRQNLIMKYNGKSYLVPGDRLGNVFGESNVDVDNLYKVYQLRQNLIDRYGEEAYWADPSSAQIENALNNYGAASVRRASTGIAGSYKLPTFGLTTSSENNLE